jgi:pyruvate,water dikinase
MATVPVGIIAGIAGAVERPDLLMPIIAGIGEVDSAAPSFALWDMGRAVAASTELTAAFDAGAETVLGTLGQSDSPEAAAFLKDFEDFLYEFGSRGPNEWECRSPTWDTKPSLALGAIERMRMAADNQAPAVLHAARVKERAAASAELLALVEGDAETHGTLSAAIASTAAWLPGRERTKTNNIRLIHEMRVRMREIGRRMVGLGGFDEIEDFGFVTQDEYPALFEAPTSMLEMVRERRSEYEGWLEKEPEFVFSKPPADPATWRRRDSTDSESVSTGDALLGIPGCSGVVEGRARVVLDSNDPTRLEPGDILVAPITDPSWTPLFVPAAGVVVDVGAPLSHAIIVSRELGIPCVVSVTDGTRRIPDGATIRVDGDTGTVTIL